jgi:hypothetical protein
LIYSELMHGYLQVSHERSGFIAAAAAAAAVR